MTRPPEDPGGNAAERAEGAATWCVRFAEGTQRPDDGDAFGQWLAEHPENGATYEQALMLWQGIDLVRDGPEMMRFRREAMVALQQANARRWSNDNDGDPEGCCVERGRRRFWTWFGAVAACLALIVSITLWYPNYDMQNFETGVGERRVVMLEDGTRMTLDASSRINVRMDSDRRRLELLQGRVKLDVAHDSLRPLSVLAAGRLTVATGTSSSVELLPREMRVVLFEGRVEVMQDGARKGATLTPGRVLVAPMDSTRARIAPIDLQREATWESGQLSFADEPLASAIERVNRSTQTPLVIADPEIRNYGISGVFNTGDTDAFVEGLVALHGVRVERNGAEIILRKKN